MPSKGPFKYYVSMFSAFLGPPTYVNINSTVNQQQLPFSDPTQWQYLPTSLLTQYQYGPLLGTCSSLRAQIQFQSKALKRRQKLPLALNSNCDPQSTIPFGNSGIFRKPFFTNKTHVCYAHTTQEVSYVPFQVGFYEPVLFQNDKSISSNISK